MKAFDFEAVVYEGQVYCVGCSPVGDDPDKCDAIFADSEWESAPVCDACYAVHDYVNITGELVDED